MARGEGDDIPNGWVMFHEDIYQPLDEEEEEDDDDDIQYARA